MKLHFLIIFTILLSSCNLPNKLKSIEQNKAISLSKKLSTKEYQLKYEKLMEQMPALKNFAPDTYNKLIEIIAKAYEDGRTTKEINNFVRSIMFDLVESRLAHASDSAILDYMEIVVLQMIDLNQLEGDVCYTTFTYDGKGHVDRTFTSKELINREITAINDVLATSVEQKLIPSEIEAGEIMEPIVSFLENKYGDDYELFGNIPSQPTSEEKKLVCDISIDFFSILLDLPSQDTLIAIRWLWGSPD